VIVNLSGLTKKTFINFNASGLSAGTVYHLHPFPVGTARGVQQDPPSGYTANYTSMYLRGSFNDWGNSNPMQLVADNTWRTTVSGLSGGETFKFEVTGRIG
jgi:1,4-alpha-glucan branching enzyme